MKGISLDPDVKVLLPDGSTRSLMTFLLPSAILMVAAIMLITSMVLPYWSMTFKAPQFPKGLRVFVYVDHIAGGTPNDITEIDGLNHYLGMPKLESGGEFERSVSVMAIIALGMLLLATLFVHNQWAALLALPAIGFPFAFLADLWYILYVFGHSLKPDSALGGAIKPFTPPIFGTGKVGQFSTLAEPQIGLVIAFAAALVVLIGLYYHRIAYKPIVDARKRMAPAPMQATEAQASKA